MSVRRYDNHKEAMPLDDISTTVKSYLDNIQADMLKRATENFDQRIRTVTNWDDFVPTLDAKCALVIPWCEAEQCEDDIKERSKSQSVVLCVVIIHTFGRVS